MRSGPKSLAVSPEVIPERFAFSAFSAVKLGLLVWEVGEWCCVQLTIIYSRQLSCRQGKEVGCLVDEMFFSLFV